MNINNGDFNQIATMLARHFDSAYYVEIETGNYCEIIRPKMLQNMSIPQKEEDFFAFSQQNAYKVVHPDDLELVLRAHNMDSILDHLEKNDSYSVSCRLLMNGQVIHVRHIDIMCEDRKHIICCMENVESEFRERQEQERNLASARLFARRDELTGIKNQNAFSEEIASMDEKIQSGVRSLRFALVVCDLNDLKRINDTRGHSFGDEALQHASRMICEIYKHSPVFRIGGDEFAVIVSGDDYENRDFLLNRLRSESVVNNRMNSGPVVACGMEVYDSERDVCVSGIFERADQLMYENKNDLKSQKIVNNYERMDELAQEIPLDRKNHLNTLFGALLTVAAEGYLFLNDMRYDYSRWSFAMVNDFDIKSEYMYHADQIWLNYIHPDDIEMYKEAVELVLRGDSLLKPICYRARKADGNYILLSTRGFVLMDDDGNPEYFGGLIYPVQ